jgi:hypothetical protein
MARQRDTKSTKTTGSHAQETYGTDLRLQSWLREQDKKQKDLHERMEKLRVVQKMNALNQCTFAPHINHKDQNIENSSIQATVDRLYQDVDKINRTKRIQMEKNVTAQRQIEEMSHCTFTPRINQNVPGFIDANHSEPVFERLSKPQKKSSHSLKNAECTFKPSIIKPPAAVQQALSRQNVFERLSTPTKEKKEDHLPDQGKHNFNHGDFR